MSTTIHSSVLPADSEVSPDGHLMLGGCDCVDLAREFGTPLYVMAESELRSRAARFLDAFAATGVEGKVMFATKACPIVAVEEIFASLGMGADVTSGGELRIALRAGFAPADILYHGNAKSDWEIADAVDSQVGLIVIDNSDEIERISDAAAGAGRVQKVLVRVTPGVEGDTIAAISTGQADSKFGVNLEIAPEVIERIENDDNLVMQGLHIHVGSQLGDTGAIARAAAAIAHLGNFPVVNLGGGLGVAYRRGEADGDIEAFVAGAAEAARQHFGDSVSLMIEPGRALVATSGVTLYSVETVKTNVSNWVAVDGGISDNLRPLAYGSRYEALVANRAAAAPSLDCRLVGKHCESGDVIVEDASLADPLRGDIVAVPVTGAYGHSMASNYNSALRPAVVMVDQGSARVAVRRETFDDLLAREQAGSD
jgi:diaminopimelate decarboxylase